MHLWVVLLAAITSAALWLNTADTPLPAPAHAHRVIDLDPTHIPEPGNASPLEGPYAPNELLLRHAKRLFDGRVHASESVAIAPNGDLTLLDKYGYLHTARPPPGKAHEETLPEEYVLDESPAAYVGPGRPLGMHYDQEGNLVICDSLKGLIKWDPKANRLIVLANRVSPDSTLEPGTPIVYANDLDIVHEGNDAHAAGTIYFSDSQSIPVGLNPETGAFYDTFRSFLLGLMSGAHAGRLLRHDPSSGRTVVLANGFFYANGVALSADGSFVAVVETNRLRVMRYWLAGPQAGTTDVLIERLPGIPDGISRAPDGDFWVALVAPANSPFRMLRFKAMRAIMARLPKWARPKPQKWGAVLKISPQGKPLALLLDLKGENIDYVSSITEHKGRLYFGNVVSHFNSYVKLSDVGL